MSLINEIHNGIEREKGFAVKSGIAKILGIMNATAYKNYIPKSFMDN